MNWLADYWESYFNPEFLRRGWFLSPFKSRGDVPTPAQFYLRPLLYQDKFPKHRHIELSPEVAARVAAQEAAGHVVFEVAENSRQAEGNEKLQTLSGRAGEPENRRSEALSLPDSPFPRFPDSSSSKLQTEQ